MMRSDDHLLPVEESAGNHAGRRGGRRAGLVVIGVTAAVVLAGCAVGGNSYGGPMMGGTGPGPGAGTSSGYPQSRLSCTAPASLPGLTVSVTVADMGMMSPMGGDAPMGARMLLQATPSTVPAGQVSFVVSNLGWRTHELVILPLPAGASAGQRVLGADGKVDETGSLGEASKSCGAGTGDGITYGTVGWTTITLKPGRYELVCNLTNHYTNGMYQELDVS